MNCTSLDCSALDIGHYSNCRLGLLGWGISDLCILYCDVRYYTVMNSSVLNITKDSFLQLLLRALTLGQDLCYHDKKYIKKKFPSKLGGNFFLKELNHRNIENINLFNKMLDPHYLSYTKHVWSCRSLLASLLIFCCCYSY